MSGNIRVNGSGNSAVRLRALAWRFIKTLGITVFALLAFTLLAWALRKYVFTEDDWQQYVSAAALLIGVGGAFGLGTVLDDGLKESANVTAITGIAAGGVMMAYKEIAVLGLGDGFFWKALGLFLVAYTIMFSLAAWIEIRSRRTHTTAPDHNDQPDGRPRPLPSVPAAGLGTDGDV